MGNLKKGYCDICGKFKFNIVKNQQSDFHTLSICEDCYNDIYIQTTLDDFEEDE